MNLTVAFAGVAAARWRPHHCGAAGHGNYNAAWVQRPKQCFPSPVKRLGNIHIPIAAEGLPRVVLKWPV